MKKMSVIVLIFLSLLSNPISASENEHVYMVTFDDDVNVDMIISHEGEIIEQYVNIPVALVRLSEAKAQALSLLESVQSVEIDKQISVEYSSSEWGINTINIENAWGLNYKGDGINIAVIDTGIDSTHEDLKIAGGRSFVGNNPFDYEDRNGHGTHVAGIIGAQHNSIGINGIAPNADIYALKVMDDNGIGKVSATIRAIDWSISNGMDILNLSLGSIDYTNAYQAIVTKAYEHDLLLISSAGNEGSLIPEGDVIEYPANFDEVFAIGAIKNDYQRAKFSAHGPNLEFVAPGVNIKSTAIDGYEKKNGTSMAAPYVSGVFALMKQAYPTYSNHELRTLAQQNSIDLGVEGRDPLYGFGLINGVFKQDITSPETPEDLFARSRPNGLSLSWELDTLPGDDVGFYVYVNNERINSEPIYSMTYNLSSLVNYTSYKIEVSSIDPSGNESPKTKAIHATPSTKMNPIKFQQNEQDLHLSWIPYVYEHIDGYVVFIGQSKEGKVVKETETTITNLPDWYKVTYQVAALFKDGSYSIKSDLINHYTIAFNDVPPDYWALNEISYSVNRAFMVGEDNLFKPNQPLTRAETARILNRFLKNEEVYKVSSFHDISDNHPDFKAIESLKQKKIMLGYNNDTYAPNEFITRKQLAAIIDRAISVEHVYRMVNPYVDISSHDWAHPSILSLYQKNILKGSAHRYFLPNERVTRAQMATVLYRLATFLK